MSRLVFALLAIGALAATAYADETGRDATGLPHVIRTDTDGFQGFYDIAPNRNSNTLFQDCISDTSVASMCDSSSVLDTHGLRVYALRFRCTNVPAGGFVRFAVQIRGHQNGLSDSSSTFPWQMKGADTLAFVQSTGQVNGGAASNEFIVTLFSMQSGTAGLKWGSPTNATIMLRDYIGEEWWSDYTSIRVCLLNKTATVSATNYTVSLVASPL